MCKLGSWREAKSYWTKHFTSCASAGSSQVLSFQQNWWIWELQLSKLGKRNIVPIEHFKQFKSHNQRAKLIKTHKGQSFLWVLRRYWHPSYIWRHLHENATESKASRHQSKHPDLQGKWRINNRKFVSNSINKYI